CVFEVIVVGGASSYSACGGRKQHGRHKQPEDHTGDGARLTNEIHAQLLDDNERQPQKNVCARIMYKSAVPLSNRRARDDFSRISTRRWFHSFKKALRLLQ